MGGPEKGRFCQVGSYLLGGGVLGDGLGPLGDGVFGEFSGEEETHGRLDFSGGDGGLLVVLGQSVRLAGNSLEEVSHERVHDRHGLGGNTCVGVHLLQHLVDVDRKGLLAGLLPRALSAGGFLGSLLSGHYFSK